ncbi:iron-sulfur cluster assembly protein IscA [Kingella negevensis]|uniref:iron-sulfur cluster assembly protein IscA n=1 Tax=Kingella negevensis TaxID=1522312 RepID=UPI00050A15DF|nr:iron-sulfur cluster assembly protein IscA [Kingella negevensis]MDK4685365.1 iron-sulfur cluster assembly protein IscA [Kingella negevensis]MDK4688913.1 iron-sulfur cluster assembly protein IscA [Kingella negevensis]MDK4708219.1 iron-sulfur cluster assembly protein IscA [Kingella negevensis]MDK4709785.1 iron-sulfur cluster assembly protein IscA [Kingella negevensis]WII92033.1 iron-sulfur cluster assembly protein IscA [Kingella negevensis]
MITVTSNAATHIRNYLTKRGKGEGIRIGVKTSGCSGMAYTLEFVDEVQPEDTVFEQDGVKVFIDPKSLVYLDGTQVDYTKEGLQEGFKFENPNVKESCGCGESFHV